MAIPAPTDPAALHRYTAERYFALVTDGVLSEDDRVELLEGVIVSMAPSDPEHSTGVGRVDDALRSAIGARATIRSQAPLAVGAWSVPEPDIAVVPGQRSDYDHAHPTNALLVVEVAKSSVGQDRLTKATIYAAAGIPEYWIVNVRDDQVEVFRDPDREAALYRCRTIAPRGARIALVAFADASVAVDDLLPGRGPR